MSSRDSDNANPRRGAGAPDAYPSGTPPYGIPGLGNGFDPFVQTAGPDPEPETPKTETTLTTRISINIPGSRPIPPVVMRSAVKPEEGEARAAAEPPAPAGPRHRSAPPAAPVLGVMDPSGRTSTPPDLPPQWRTPVPPKGAEGAESESTGEWFRPRQRNRPDSVGAPTAPGAPGAAVGAPGAPGGEAPLFSAHPAPGAPLRQPADGGSPFAPGPAGTGSPFAPAPGGYPGEPAQGVGGGYPHAPAATDPFGTVTTPPQGVPGYPAQGPGGTPPNGVPLHRDPQHPGFPAADGPGGTPPNGVPLYPGPQGAHPGTPPNGVPGFPGATQHQDPFAQGGAPRFPGDASSPYANDPFNTAPAQAAAAAAPGAPAEAAGQRPLGNPGAPGRFARPQQPLTPEPNRFAPSAGEPEDTQIGGFEPISGEAIPGLPVTGVYGAAPSGPAGPGGPGAPAGPDGVPNSPAPQAVSPEPPKKAAPAAKPKPGGKAKKLLVTGVGGVVFLGAAAYGTGLMLNQADVPRGTTVLGTAIGGDSRDQAVHQLDATVGKIGQKPIQLKLGSQALTLDPTTAGLTFDTTATVDGLTHHSYNPSDVLASLTGGSTAVPPAVRIDRAKLKAALDGLAANSAQGYKEGFVQFDDSGAPVVVPGQPGQAVDDASAVDQVVQSYQDRANGKSDAPVTLAVTTAQPKTTTQALQQVADGLGKQIASGPVTIQAGAKKLVLSPAKFGKALVLSPDASGNIGPQWDLNQLGTLVGNAFDKVKYKKSDGTLAPITTQDVADAITQVYDKNTTTDRTFHFRM
ncbi:peptidoglycan binding domain-containing protein [Kitasatospora viridis]|uniref:Putative peptidoglycan binding protein n=1 Tax=Kitasatospora viridis TaxID=281105 RepID=A0A561UFG9_9ACTN|nr:peptidoglycan binding domain-containing protein [Kitasatospora viridis]TWF98100.1 putative peptidoglycan binding protein [Kitasatospora viridis]